MDNSDTQFEEAGGRKKTWQQLLAVIAVAAGVLASVVRGYIWCHGNVTAECQGYMIGGLMIPTLVAYLFAGRKKVRSGWKFGLIFLGTNLLELFLELASRITHST